MSIIKTSTIALLLAALNAPTSVFALQITNFATLTEKQIKQSYYFDWNRNSTFRAAMVKAFKTSGMAMPAWLRQGSGGAAPAKVIPSGPTKFVLLDTCKPRECNDNIAYVLFDPITKNTSIVGKFDKKTVWVGKPGAAEKQILSNVSGLK